MFYTQMPPRAFWKLCREYADFRLSELYRPKLRLEAGMRVATAGSCFAQNLGRYIRSSELSFLDAEPAPASMPPQIAKRFGYGIYSARYGNIYTVRQLRQLLEDACARKVHRCAIWDSGGCVFDALRPGCEPDGFASVREMRIHRTDHLHRVLNLFTQADVFVFTLGLTEAWTDRKTGIVFPSAPGVIAGRYDPKRHAFRNFGLRETARDLTAVMGLLHKLAANLLILLTVSPVPLTATASGQHVLRATSYSKSVLCAVAQECAAADPRIDYIPSYEMIAGTPFAGRYYADNLRNVTPQGVQGVMSAFFAAHGLRVPDLVNGPKPPVGEGTAADATDADGEICEEALFEAFAPT